MDRRTWLAISLCFLIFLGWQKFYLEPRALTQRNTLAPMTSTVSLGSSFVVRRDSLPVSHDSSLGIESKEISSDTGIAKIGGGSKFFVGWNLKAYRLGISPEAAAVDIKSVTNQTGEGQLAFDADDLAYLNDVQGKISNTPHSVVWSYEDTNVKLSREISKPEQQAYLDIKINAEFKGKRPNFAFVSLSSQSVDKDQEAQDRQLVYWTNQSIEREIVKSSLALKEISTPVKWIGVSNRYFILAFLPQGTTQPRGLIQPINSDTGRISLVYPISGNSINIPFRVYFGPKELGILRSIDPTLDNAVDFGWFTIFAYPLLKGLKWFYQFVHNYGAAIILLTLLLKILTYPLTFKSMKSMKEMAKIQPQLQRLRERYKDDREALNREMLTLMRSHGYNPMAGCLPILIQMPIFFALYRVLYSSIELYHAPFGFWIHDLSAKDPYYVTPVLLGITMFIQQKLTPNTATDPAQAKMMQFMPLMFTAFMLALPSGLTLYMLTNALASILQQMVLNKKLDAGHVSAFAARTR